jgi:hypothetical protein
VSTLQRNAYRNISQGAKICIVLPGNCPDLSIRPYESTKVSSSPHDKRMAKSGMFGKVPNGVVAKNLQLIQMI